MTTNILNWGYHNRDKPGNYTLVCHIRYWFAESWKVRATLENYAFNRSSVFQGKIGKIFQNEYSLKLWNFRRGSQKKSGDMSVKHNLWITLKNHVFCSTMQ